MSVKKSISFVVAQPNVLDAPLAPDDLVLYDSFNHLRCPYCHERPDFDSYDPSTWAWTFACGTSIKYTYDYYERALCRVLLVSFIQSDVCRETSFDDEDII